MTHTPGPWTINQVKSPVYGTNGQLVAEAHGIGNGSRFIGTAYRDDDAHLIAAAPELLDALKGYNLIDYTVLIGDALILNTDPRVAKILEQLAAEIQQVRPTATAAISKAEGKG